MSPEIVKSISTRLTRAIVITDTETSGLNLKEDEAVSFAGFKIFPNGKTQEKYLEFKPTCKIHPEASKINGYTAESLKDKQPFASHAKEIADFFKNSDIGGFNIIKFDLVILDRQLDTAGFKNVFKKAKVIDSYVLYLKHSHRRLADAFEHYLSKPIENAHNALGDVLSTVEILERQLAIENATIDQTVKKYQDLKDEKKEDTTLILNADSKYVINFGVKYKDVLVEKCPKDFLRWMMNKQFSDKVKDVIKNYI